ncbi:MAG: MBL fold metallo-hydrolase [Roseburia sp.]|nr:MBL fold metallo-hydrolase [Roseburia sp.]
MELCSIASGSSGNCIYIGTESGHILIDAGISGKRIEEGLNSFGLKTAEMQGILVTHEHIDHVAGLGVLARRYGIPLFATKGTIEAVKRMSSVGKIDESLFHVIEPEREFCIGDMTIEPIAISHDAADPVAYRVKQGKKRVAVMTDLGYYDARIVQKLQNLDVLLLEANHDVRMLELGPYPYPLKQRILGDRGHLSNENCGRLLSEVLHDNFKAAVLGHLSKENNYPQLAYETVRVEVDMGETPYHADDFPMHVAKRDQASCRISF